MTHKSKVAEVVENGFDNLPGTPVYTFPHFEETSKSPIFNGHDPWSEIREAVSEKDIMNLRESLQKILSEKGNIPHNSGDLFHLTKNQDLDALSGGLNQVLPNVEDLLEPLPKIHIHHHQRSEGETIHPYYKEQLHTGEDVSDEFFPVENEDDWTLVAAAVQERDIMDLRQKLQFIGSNSITHPYTTEEIEAYLEGSLLPEELLVFENELAVNDELQSDVELNLELEEAIGEEDVMELRGMLGGIIRSQNSTTRTVAEIDSFLEGELDHGNYAGFVEEMADNQGLRNEVKLMQDVNASLTENDIMKLRSELQQVIHAISQHETQSVIPVATGRNMLRKVGTAAAILLMVFGFSFLFRQNESSIPEVYTQFYEPPGALSAFRSAGSRAGDYLSEGIACYNRADYQAALRYFGKIAPGDKVNPAAAFYSGASYQNLEKYAYAVAEYDKVILHKQSIFVEQAEWYRALSLLALGNTSQASSQLNQIVVRKGFYAKHAGELLATLERRKR